MNSPKGCTCDFSPGSSPSVPNVHTRRDCPYFGLTPTQASLKAYELNLHGFEYNDIPRVVFYYPKDKRTIEQHERIQELMEVGYSFEDAASYVIHLDPQTWVATYPDVPNEVKVANDLFDQLKKEFKIANTLLDKIKVNDLVLRGITLNMMEMYLFMIAFCEPTDHEAIYNYWHDFLHAAEYCEPTDITRPLFGFYMGTTTESQHTAAIYNMTRNVIRAELTVRLQELEDEDNGKPK